jgi:hypothetical protein
MKNPVRIGQTFVVRNKTKIVVAVAATAVVVIAAQRAGLNQHNEFLKEKNLFDEYYAPQED